MDNITKDELILKGEIRDHLLMLSLIQKYGLDQNLLIQQIEYVFHEQFLTQDADAQKSLSKHQYAEIVIQYAYSLSSVRYAQNPELGIFSKISEKCADALSDVSLDALANLSIVSVQQQLDLLPLIKNELIRNLSSKAPEIKTHDAQPICLLIGSLHLS